MKKKTLTQRPKRSGYDGLSEEEIAIIEAGDIEKRSEKNQPRKVKQKRINQTQKIIYLDDELLEAWEDFQYDYKKRKKKKLTFQGFVEGYLRKELKDFLP